MTGPFVLRVLQSKTKHFQWLRPAVQGLRCRLGHHAIIRGPHLHDATPEGEHWRWAITGDIIPNMPSDGFTDTLADAKRDFAAAWRRWLTKAGKHEETHRAFYGRPVDIR